MSLKVVFIYADTLRLQNEFKYIISIINTSIKHFIFILTIDPIALHHRCANKSMCCTIFLNISHQHEADCAD